MYCSQFWGLESLSKIKFGPADLVPSENSSWLTDGYLFAVSLPGEEKRALWSLSFLRRTLTYHGGSLLMTHLNLNSILRFHHRHHHIESYGFNIWISGGRKHSISNISWKQLGYFDWQIISPVSLTSLIQSAIKSCWFYNLNISLIKIPSTTVLVQTTSVPCPLLLCVTATAPNSCLCPRLPPFINSF